MIKGTMSDNVCKWLNSRLPLLRRRAVKTITLDMSRRMALIARKCFPLAKQIIERFHVQKDLKEALQDIRIQHRWPVKYEENKEIKKCRKKNTEYKAKVFSNGDTLRQLIARSQHLLFKNPEDWSPSQKQRVEILFDQFDYIRRFYYLSFQLCKIYSTNNYKDVARAKMTLCFNKVE